MAKGKWQKAKGKKSGWVHFSAAPGRGPSGRQKANFKRQKHVLSRVEGAKRVEWVISCAARDRAGKANPKEEWLAPRRQGNSDGKSKGKWQEAKGKKSGWAHFSAAPGSADA